MSDYVHPNDKTEPADGPEPDDDLISDNDLDGVFGAGMYWEGNDGSGS